jgi:hypothetical protein
MKKFQFQYVMSRLKLMINLIGILHKNIYISFFQCQKFIQIESMNQIKDIQMEGKFGTNFIKLSINY